LFSQKIREYELRKSAPHRGGGWVRTARCVRQMQIKHSRASQIV